MLKKNKSEPDKKNSSKAASSNKKVQNLEEHDQLLAPNWMNKKNEVDQKYINSVKQIEIWQKELKDEENDEWEILQPSPSYMEGEQLKKVHSQNIAKKEKFYDATYMV